MSTTPNDESRPGNGCQPCADGEHADDGEQRLCPCCDQVIER